MSETKYKIAGLYYSKPALTRNVDGEAFSYRYGVYINVGQACDYDGLAPRRVTNIMFDKDSNSFRVHYDKGGLKIIPFLEDTEVVYQEEKTNK